MLFLGNLIGIISKFVFFEVLSINFSSAAIVRIILSLTTTFITLGFAPMDEKSKIPSITDDDVKVWSDFLRMRYHPKTNVILKEYQHNNATK